MERIVLASGSPRRKQLLEWAEVDFEVMVKDTPETWPPELAIADVPVYIARNKALAVKAAVGPGRVVIAADTVVVLEDEIIGKPRDRADAVNILSRLAGHRHEVITGVVLLRDGEEQAFADTTAVWFHPLSTAEIEGYVDRYKPYDKAGAYAIQEWIGVVGIKGIEGDFYNVMGLPVSRVVQALRKWR
ncbi:Maf family protein [Puia dinghuensis]|uniref:dTTP/UTP pyrophosphatase n=1 Tax=Puia dinghuensis TaxID=1792502 RepID=A0A8J2XNG6_9BACT|nr:Maf family protein [Puia dinghuensis]GGA83720.1 Maf-like protein [Puia dinghuensis]